MLRTQSERVALNGRTTAEYEADLNAFIVSSYTCVMNPESQPRPTSLQSGAISDVGNINLTDEILTQVSNITETVGVKFEDISKTARMMTPIGGRAPSP